MTDAETIEALRAELEVQKKSYWDLFRRNCDMEKELRRLESMRSVLWTLCDLTREVHDQRRATEGKQT